MKPISTLNIDQDGMAEATRLTRSGKLAQATALIQTLLKKGSSLLKRKPLSDKLSIPDYTDFAPIPTAPDILRPQPTPEPEIRRETVKPLQKPQFIKLSYSNLAGTRAYKLYTPGGSLGGARPLIIMMHGCVQSPDDFAAGTGMNAMAEIDGCYVAYPEQNQQANANKCWNWFNPADQSRDQGEPAIIAGLTRQILADYPIDPRRVYIAGLSAGGAAAATMAVLYPDLYAAVGVHSGLACGAANSLPAALMAMKRGEYRPTPSTAPFIVPTIVFHGDQDTIVHPRNAEQVIAQAKSALDHAGLNHHGLRRITKQERNPGGHAYEVTRETDAQGRTLIEYWMVQGAGHAWSGGQATGSYTDPRGPDATREMLRFFLEHRLPA